MSDGLCHNGLHVPPVCRVVSGLLLTWSSHSAAHRDWLLSLDGRSEPDQIESQEHISVSSSIPAYSFPLVGAKPMRRDAYSAHAPGITAGMSNGTPGEVMPGGH